MSKGGKVLLVDDSLTARKMLLSLCRKFGFTNFVEADRAEDAMAKLLIDGQFDLIVCDWNMPGVNGYEFLSNVKSNPQTKHIPFIFVTAESEGRHIAAAKEMGALEFLIKPINPHKFSDVLEQLLGGERKAA